MATTDAFARLMGTKSAANVLVGQTMIGAGPHVSTAMNMGSSGADADHGLTPFNHGFGAISSKQLRVKAVVTVAIDNLTSIIFNLRQGSDDPLTADLVTLYSTPPILLADVDAIGDVIMDIPLPEVTDQFLDLQAVITGAAPAAGAVAAFIQLATGKGHGL